MITSYYAEAVGQLETEGNLRRLPDTADRHLVDLSSNDYLGLAARCDLREEFYAGRDVAALPLTSAASRLLAGRQEEHTELENYLKTLYGREILTANSGYHANVGQVAALGSAPDTLIIADKLVHASIIDGIRLSGAPFERFRHNDMAHLERLLARGAGRYSRVWVITESVFSMDGDTAPIDELAALKRRYDNVGLYVDEAHAIGVEGEGGLGLCRSSQAYADIDVVVGTFGKAAASMGAFAAVSPALKSYFVNRSRAHIFSTALPPLQAAWTLHVMRHIVGMDTERAHLKALGTRLHDRLAALGSESSGSHIQPFIVGSPHRAVALSKSLAAEGFKVLPIRVPTVPPGTDRLRISLSASLTPEQIDRFADTLATIVSQ